MTELAQQDVLATVRSALAARTAGGIRLEILEKGIRQEDDWWYVPVRPVGKTERTVQYYDLLAEIEGELQDKMNLHILLIPTGPDES